MKFNIGDRVWAILGNERLEGCISSIDDEDTLYPYAVVLDDESYALAFTEEELHVSDGNRYEDIIL